MSEKNWWEDEKRFPGKPDDKFTSYGDDFFLVFKTLEEAEEWERTHPPKVPYITRTASKG